MRTRRSNPLHASRLRPLAACLAIAISGKIFAGPDVGGSMVASIPPAVALRSARAEQWAGAVLQAAFGKSVVAPDHPTTTLTVKNCDDAGQDSLREAVGLAPDGATIEFDLNQTGCSKITLSTGQIDIPVANLKIHGPGANALTIDGGYDAGDYNRIFNHSGSGTLEIDGLTLTDAKYTANNQQDAAGGCIYSNGSILLIGATISRCGAVSTSADAWGGGISSKLSVAVLDSTVSDCVAISTTASAQGGGIFVGSLAGGTLTAKYSTIENTRAHSYSPSPFQSKGGGILSMANSATIGLSTISGNRADEAGGIYARNSTTISDSTISGNEAEAYGGAELTGSATVTSSEVVFNTATGFHRIAGVHAGSLTSNSSIFAQNRTDDGSGAVETDVESGDGMIAGANNLIMATSASTPMNTLSSCPRLAPLLNNGGRTHTHALLPGSPAIDAGNNAENLDTDQRGAGFDRIVGLAPDIGPYEWSDGSGDVINSSGFEDCN